MNRSIPALAVALLAASSAAAQTPPPAGPSVIVVNGTATVERAPDRAFLQLSTESRAPKPEEAQQKNEQAMTGVQQAVKNFQQAAGLTHYYNRHKFHFLAVSFDERLGRILTIMSCPGDWPQLQSPMNFKYRCKRSEYPFTNAKSDFACSPTSPSPAMDVSSSSKTAT